MDFKKKYIKYKIKYLYLKNSIINGGNNDEIEYLPSLKEEILSVSEKKDEPQLEQKIVSGPQAAPGNVKTSVPPDEKKNDDDEKENEKNIKCTLVFFRNNK